MVLQRFHGKGPHLLLWADSRATTGKIIVIGMPNCLNYCVIFRVHTQFKNVAAGHVIQPGGPRVGDPWCTPTCV